MEKTFCSFVLTLVVTCGAVPAFAAFECTDVGEWLEKPCRRLANTYRDGNNEMFLSGYSWHLPMTYTKEKRKELNENAFGFGMGRIVEDPDGDTHSVFFVAFLDSHKNVQWNLGYTWSTYWGRRDLPQFGLGYVAAIVQRPDIFHGIPFPAALPLVSLRYKEATLVTTFIPTVGGGVNNGSVLYVFGRYTFK
ncbi:MAG: phospholipid:lipid A palmitoyltransferase [Proteobacteria bacterium]|nr:phospholipid:lipid A palmitoyltransferase [Pseudomonadota bacterium]MCL2308068.1 phospholipid:lipid A palmitoyltransferase [Pseudomonadota bacterium]